MKKVKIVHCMRDKYDIYIGRPGKWGNPFTHEKNTMAKYKVASREEAIEKYREYILSRQDLLDALPKLEGKVLGCWCAGPDGLTTEDKPFKCHGQVLAELLEEYYG